MFELPSKWAIRRINIGFNRRKSCMMKCYFTCEHFVNKKCLADFSYATAGSRKALMHFFSSQNTLIDETHFMSDHRPTKHFFIDETALSMFKKITKLDSTSEADSLSKTLRNQDIRQLKHEGLTAKQIARFMDVSLTTVKRICKVDP